MCPDKATIPATARQAAPAPTAGMNAAMNVTLAAKNGCGTLAIKYPISAAPACTAAVTTIDMTMADETLRNSPSS